MYINRNVFYCLTIKFLLIQGITHTNETPIQNMSSSLEAIQKEAIQALGYNPNIIIDYGQRQDEQPDARRASHPTIYVHGFGDNGYSFQPLMSQWRIDSTPAVFFDLPDAGLRQANTFVSLLASLRKSGFGQLPDIKSILFILKKCHDARCTGVDFYGLSRGGTTIINTLAVLNNQKYQSVLDQLGIDQAKKQAIIQMLRNGCTTIDAPLKNFKETLTSTFSNIRQKIFGAASKRQALRRSCIKNFLCRIGAFCGRQLDSYLAAAFNYVFIPVITSYRPRAEQAINSAQQLNGLQVPILLHTETADGLVSNWGDRKFYEILRGHNPSHTYFHKSTDRSDLDGPHHMVQRDELPVIFQAFKNRYGYKKQNNPDDLNILAQNIPDPSTIEDN